MGLLHQPAIGLHRRIEGIAMAYAGSIVRNRQLKRNNKCLI